MNAKAPRLVLATCFAISFMLAGPRAESSPADLPGHGAAWQASCLNGEWREQYEKPFHWTFSATGNTLHVERTDKFVAGDFTRSGDRYVGSIHWGNGETWSHIVLTPNSDCSQVATNQSWWYRR
jgi:hypothetical protein